MKSNEPVLLGIIGAPHGVRGWVRVNSYTQQPEDVFGYENWTLGDRLVAIVQWKQHGRRWIAKLKGIDTPEQAAELTGTGIYVEAGSLPELDEGECYWNQLIGARVTTMDHQLLGKVGSMFETASNDVMVVNPSVESLDKRERLIPYIEGQVVRSMEREAPGTGAVTQIWVDWDLEF